MAHADGWIRFGGAGFLISTAQMNAYLLLLPQWVTAMYLSCVAAGRRRWNTPGGTRIGLTIAVYAIAFSVAGHDFNQYWGSLTAPLFCLAACRLPRQAIAATLWTRRRSARCGLARRGFVDSVQALTARPASTVAGGSCLSTSRNSSVESVEQLFAGSISSFGLRRHASWRPARRSIAQVDVAVDQVQRPAANLVVDPRHVLAQHADAQGR